MNNQPKNSSKQIQYLYLKIINHPMINNHHSLRLEENPFSEVDSSFANIYDLLYILNTPELAFTHPTPINFFDFDFSAELEPIEALESQEVNATSFLGLSPATKKISKVFHIIREPKRDIDQKDHSAQKYHNKRTKQVRWSSTEDNQIRELIAQYGERWTLLSKIVGTRTGKQIRDRYNNYLRSDITNAKFTQEEDSKLLELFEEFGNKWTQIAEYMPGRTEGQVKNRYHSYLKKNLSLEDSLSFQAEKGVLSCTEADTNRQELLEGEEDTSNPTDLISYSVQHDKGEEDEDRFSIFVQSIIDCNQEAGYRIPEFSHKRDKGQDIDSSDKVQMEQGVPQAEIK